MDHSDLAILFDDYIFWSEQPIEIEGTGGKISEYMQTEGWTVEGLEALLKEGHDPNKGWVGDVEADACLPLVIATQCHNLFAVKVLLNHGAKAQKKDYQAARRNCKCAGLSALDEAGIGCCLCIIQEIFKYEVDKDDCNLALVSAVENDRIDIVRFLCKQGVKLDADCDEEKSAMFIATEKQNMEIIDLLLKHGASVEFSKHIPLVEACRISNMDIVKQLIKGGCSVNEQEKDVFKFIRGHWTSTPLCAAVRNKHEDIVRYLIEEEGANVNRLRSLDVETPINIAAGMGDLKMVEYLFGHGAKVCDDEYTSIRDTSLELACLSNSVEVVKFMIDKGTVLDVRANGLNTVIKDLTRTTNNYDQILKLLFSESVLVFYGLSMGEKDGWEEFLSRFVDSCIANPKLFKWIIRAGCRRTVLFKLRHFEFIPDMFPQDPYGYWWSNETAASYREYFRQTAQDLADCAELRTFIDNVITSPEQLTVMCRQKIRDCLRTHISSKVQALPLPSCLKSYLLIPENDSIIENQV